MQKHRWVFGDYVGAVGLPSDGLSLPAWAGGGPAARQGVSAAVLKSHHPLWDCSCRMQVGILKASTSQLASVNTALQQKVGAGLGCLKSRRCHAFDAFQVVLVAERDNEHLMSCVRMLIE